MPHAVFSLLALAGAAVAAGLPQEAAPESPWLRWLRKRRGEVPFSIAPGIAAVVVSQNGDRVEVLAGDGVRSLRSREAVTPGTLFEVGSVSKTLVALALATLVDDGRLSWDTRVADVLGPDFGFGPDPYVREQLTLRDLMAHRSGLGEGQGDFLGALMPSARLAHQLRNVRPRHGFREVFDYSNTGWALAGEVLRAAVNASSWCEALHWQLLTPMHMAETFCDRNEVPAALEEQVADVHKSSPCDGLQPPAAAFRMPMPVSAPKLRTYRMVRTGPPGAWAGGAADAAGSVLSSARDMAKVMKLLLGVGVPKKWQVVSQATLQEMLSAQMVVPSRWLKELGVPDGPVPDHFLPGASLAAGLGFDLVGEFPSGSRAPVLRGRPYGEKNGDTAMHKARLGLLPEQGVAVMLLSNLGGEVGGQLTALKFGLLALAAGATEEEADDVVQQTFDVTNFWDQQYGEYRNSSTCTPCGTVLLDTAICQPWGSATPPVPFRSLVGSFGDDFYGHDALRLYMAGKKIKVRVGPVNSALVFGASSTVIAATCPELAAKLSPHAAEALAGRGGRCRLVELRLPGELPPVTGLSERNGTIAFPWGCGTVPVPTAMPIHVITAEDTKEAWAWLSTVDVILPRSPRPAGTLGADPSEAFVV